MINIHQIWLTEYTPEHIQVWMKTWEKAGNYKLWTYSNIGPYYGLVEKAGLTEVHPALQSDLIRLAIILDHGGLYVDCDCELIGTIPELKYGTVAHWYDGADPLLIYAESNNVHVKAMYDFGFTTSDFVPEIYRWGFKAFNKFWAGNIEDVQDWCKHRSQHSWG
jgi:hypothetical protein